MKLLLDTHIWIWALTRPKLLGPRLRRQIESPKNQLFLSPVSLWEAGHLERKGRLRIKQSLPAWIEDALGRMPLHEVPFNFAVASRACELELPQNDVGDTLLAATALVFELTLVTADTQLIECPWLKTLPNA
jgi:PIN domain nuclease of toxin-antitoxin system